MRRRLGTISWASVAFSELNYRYIERQMKKQILTFALLTASVAATAQVTEQKPYWAQADTLCAKLMTMDTHNHIDVPMMTENMPGPRVDLRTAMKKAGMSAIGMTFAVDYVQPLKEGQEYERFVNAMTAQDSILRWSGLRLTLSAKEMLQRFKAGEPVVIQCVEGGHFLEGDISRMKEAYDRGLRVFCLLHDNDANHPLGDVYTNEPKFGGLTTLGAEAIRECERLGILVDLAHCDSATIAQALKVATRPVLISHTGLSTRLGSNEFMGKMMRERFQKEQAKREAERKAKGEKEGPRPQFQPRNPNAANHEWGQEPDNFYHSVIRCLLAEGFNAGEIEKIVSGNFLRVFSEATK